MQIKPWIENYDVGVPASINYPDICIHEMFERAAQRFKENTCIRWKNGELNYGQTKRLINALAKALIIRGIHPGNRIGLILPNTPEFIIAYYAIMSIGAVVVPLNPAYTLNELKLQIRKTQITAIFGWRERLELLRALKYESELKFLVICDGELHSESIINKKNRPQILEEEKFNDFLHFDEEGIDFPDTGSNSTALFQFSGGTTGTPKAAVALHRNIIANTYQFRNWLSSLKDGREQFLTVIPLSHVYGMVIGMNVGIAMGATINLIDDPRDTNRILETIQRQGISFYPGVPTMYHAINQNAEVKAGKYDLRSIKACISGSAPLLPEIRKEFEGLTGGKLVEGYGLSEAPTATHCNPILGENRNGSIGLPLPDVECKLSFEDQKDDTGELWIKGPQVMSHYHEDLEETERVFENGWLKTGDIARIDEDGYFYLVGRKKDLIKVGGLQVWPGEVEEAISKNPEVKDVVAAGIPDLSKGELVKAWVVLKEGCKISREMIMKNCANEIAHFKVPTSIEFISEIPRTPVGKVLRRELVKRELEKIIGSDLTPDDFYYDTTGVPG